MALRLWALDLTFVKHTRQSPAERRYLTDIVVKRSRKYPCVRLCGRSSKTLTHYMHSQHTTKSITCISYQKYEKQEAQWPLYFASSLARLKNTGNV